MRIQTKSGGTWSQLGRSCLSVLRSKLLALALWSAVAFLAGALAHRAGYFGYVREILHVATHRSSATSQAHEALPAPTLEISIGRKAYQRLKLARDEALGGPILIVDDASYESGYARVGEEVAEIRIRLKGDWTYDHLADPKKWSFRIETKDGATLLGMKRFSIHQPAARNYVGEAVFFEALRQEGVIAPRYDFLRVSLNGQDLGLYAIEEHFEKRLVENNRHREGPIVRFGEDYMWQEWLTFWPTRLAGGGTGSGSYQASPVDAFDTKKLLESDVLGSEFEAAFALLEGVRSGAIPWQRAFDLPLVAKYIALSDLFGGQHGLGWHNLRFYYNPITGLLEPIGFDAMGGSLIAALSGNGTRLDLDDSPAPPLPLAYQVPALFSAYIAEVERVSSSEWVDDFFSRQSEWIAEDVGLLRSEFPDVESPESAVRANAEYIRNVLSPPTPLVAAYEQSGSPGGGRTLTLAVGALGHLPVEILGVLASDGTILPPIGGPAILQPRTDRLREGFDGPRLSLESVVYSIVAWELDALHLAGGQTPLDLNVVCRVFGMRTAAPQRVKVYPWSYPFPAMADGILDAPPSDPASHECLEIIRETGVVYIRPGRWTVRAPIEIPPGWLVTCGPGTELVLQTGGRIVSYSPLRFVGEAEAPVRVRGESAGAGVLVLRAPDASYLENVAFEGLSPVTRNEVPLTGAVTFYETAVTIRECVFSSMACEDMLNGVRSVVDVAHCRFEAGAGDGIDLDFCESSILETSFSNIGNDAIDVSGSQVAVQHCLARDLGDKGVSAGEASFVTVSEMSVWGAGFGIVSKDRSAVTADGLDLRDCQYTLAVYQKKPEFGPAEMTIADSFEGPTAFLVEKGSVLRIAGDVIAATVQSAAGMIDGGEE